MHTHMPRSAVRTVARSDAGIARAANPPAQRYAATDAGPAIRPRLSALAPQATEPAPTRGAGLPHGLGAGIEALAGVPMDGVTVHYNSPRPARIGAMAYAQGGTIHLGRGQERHLAHEAWHVAQQRQGRVRPNKRFAGQAINDDPGLEHEAQRMGAWARQSPFASAEMRPRYAAARAPNVSEQAAAPIQGAWFTRVSPPPANLGERVAGLQHALAHAAPLDRANAHWYRTQQDSLHAAEADAHTWLRDHGHRATEQQRQEVAGHLGALEDHHSALVGVQLQHNHPLWLPQGTSAHEQGRATHVWDQVRGGTGNLTINTANAGFRTNTLADVAKLLQGQHGRDMLHELNAPQVNADNEQLTHRAVTISDAWSDDVQHAARVRGDPGSAATALDAAGGPAVVAGGPPGFGSHVRIDRGAREAVTGEHGDTSVPTPHYISLGHELGHALRNLRNTKSALPSHAGLSPLEQTLWSNPEEHANITSHENPLRSEHHLPVRKFHKSPVHVKVERGLEGVRSRVAEFERRGLDVPGWADRYGPQFGQHPETGAPTFQLGNAATHPHASDFFGPAHAHLDATLRGDTLRRGLRTGARVLGGLAVAGLGAGLAYGAHRWLTRA